jgi:hypothetical protein
MNFSLIPAVAGRSLREEQRPSGHYGLSAKTYGFWECADGPLFFRQLIVEADRWVWRLGRIACCSARMASVADFQDHSLVWRLAYSLGSIGSVVPHKPGKLRMPRMSIAEMKFAKVYPMYVQKAERKDRTQGEVDLIIRWLTGYDQAGLRRQIDAESDFKTFFAEAPALNPAIALIKGTVCGVRVEEIEDPLVQKVRYLDKLIDELAKGRPMERILR